MFVGTSVFQPAALRSLYDHPNVDPRDNFVKFLNVPNFSQNFDCHMPNVKPKYRCYKPFDTV